MVAPTSKFYTFSNGLFHKYGGANVGVTNCMSHFFYFCPNQWLTKHTGHAQGIGIILCQFANCSIIYPVGTIYYCPCHPYNTISSGLLKFYSGFKKVKSKTLGYCKFVDPKGCSWRSLYQTQNNLDYLKLEIFKVNPQRYRNVVVPIVYAL